MRNPNSSNIFLIDEHPFSLSIYLIQETARNDVRPLTRDHEHVKAKYLKNELLKWYHAFEKAYFEEEETVDLDEDTKEYFRALAYFLLLF